MSADPAPSRQLRGAEVLRDPLVRELLAARVVGVLATYGEGSIHAVPMWFALRGDRIALATGSRSRKVRNLERDPRATLVVHDSRAGFEVCGVSLAGRVELWRGADAAELVDAVHRRYVAPAGERDPAVREFLASDDTALLLAPEAALAWDERGSAASAALRAAGAALPLLPSEPRP
ncbi:MAG TPA: pyridoxamine 5'-phosphate oxidase family protein [Gaiellaceae bacterium]|nr:pyridoxamine 5'-phosphate oxidase family protein [Gaiellaceae bacterium]